MTPTSATGAAYDPATDKWRAIAEEGAPAARKDHSAVWIDGRMLVWGGSAGETIDTLQDFLDGGLYDPKTDQWTKVPAAPPSHPGKAGAYIAVALGKTFVVWGGTFAPDDGAVFDVASLTWTSLSQTRALTGRGSATAVWTGDRQLDRGGCTTEGGDACAAPLGDGRALLP